MTLVLLLLACTDKAGPSVEDTGAPCSPTAWYADQDGDAFGAGEAVEACAAPADHVEVGGDCDDSRAEVHPGATESCNGLDDDCDGLTDPPTAVDVATCTWDGDGDGWGNPIVSYTACDCNDGYTTQAGDCDDTDPDRHPGAAETWYDGIDQDCAEDDDDDADQDGWTWDGTGGLDCDDQDPAVNPDAIDICGSGVDEDCDGARPDCGLFGELAEGDAWLTVEVDLEVNEEPMFSQSVAYAGDADHDGNPELIERGQASAEHPGPTYYVMEVEEGGHRRPESLSIGTLRPFHDTPSTWTHLWMTGQHVLAGEDFDGDGYPDAVTGTPGGGQADGSPIASDPVSRLDLWSGPLIGESWGDSAQTIPDLPGADTWLTSMALLQPPGGTEPWTIVVTPSHHDVFEAGQVEALILGAPDFETGSVLGPAIRASRSGPAAGDVQAEDLDGDGLPDLIMSAGMADVQASPSPGRVWVLRGPIADDRSLDDADLVVQGSEDGDGFGALPAIVSDVGGNRRLAAPALWLFDSPVIMFFDPSVDGWLTPDDALATISPDGTVHKEVGAGAIHDIGDIDADDVPEISASLDWDEGGTDSLAIYEAPSTGTLSAADWQALLTGTPSSLGRRCLGDIDFNGDTFPDLLVGSPNWAGDRYDEFGRLQIFLGGPDGF